MDNIFDKAIKKMSDRTVYEDKFIISINNECSRITRGEGNFDTLTKLVNEFIEGKLMTDIVISYYNFIRKDLFSHFREWCELDDSKSLIDMHGSYSAYIKYTKQLVSMLNFYDKYSIDYLKLSDDNYSENILRNYLNNVCNDCELLYKALSKYIPEYKYMSSASSQWSANTRLDFINNLYEWSNNIETCFNILPFSKDRTFCKFDYYKISASAWGVPCISNIVFINQFKKVLIDELSISIAPAIYLSTGDGNYIHYGLLCVYNSKIIPVFHDASISGYLNTLFNSIEKDSDYLNKLGFIQMDNLKSVRAKSWKEPSGHIEDEKSLDLRRKLQKLQSIFNDVYICKLTNIKSSRLCVKDVYDYTYDIGYIIKNLETKSFLTKVVRMLGMEVFYCELGDELD